ncbi:hypothetical protein E3P84_04182 [Wallemia ichthyophaga]|nr:hypothetical protein E3P84_04182 [Wallemia ichthyophaga]TIB37616.1 hypothetical protein E3P83_04179 [Wallemia ichthyophaga]
MEHSSQTVAIRNYLGPTSSATRKTPKLFLLLALGFLSSSVAAFDVLGIVSGILGIVSFAQQSAPDPLPQPAMKVRLGLNGVNGGLKNAGGGLPMAKAFDYNGRQIAQNFHQTWPGLNRGSGEIFDIEFDESPQLQVQNWELHAQTDGICIAYISYQDSNGRDGAWLGDVGRHCGYPWYHANVMVGEQGNGHETACMWLDEDNSIENSPGSMRINSDAFRDNYDDACNYWWFRTGGSAFYEDASSVPLRRSSNIDRFRGILVSSPNNGHAKELCDSENSVGPDFLSQNEQLLCIMESKTLVGPCNDYSDGYCYQEDENGIKIKSAPSKNTYSIAEYDNEYYTSVVQW